MRFIYLFSFYLFIYLFLRIVMEDFISAGWRQELRRSTVKKGCVACDRNMNTAKKYTTGRKNLGYSIHSYNNTGV